MLLAGSEVVSAEPTTAARSVQVSQLRSSTRKAPSVYTRLITTSLSKIGGAAKKSKLLYGAIAAGAVVLLGAAVLLASSRNPFAECGGLFSKGDCWGAVVNKGGNIFARWKSRPRKPPRRLRSRSVAIVWVTRVAP